MNTCVLVQCMCVKDQVCSDGEYDGKIGSGSRVFVGI